MNEGGKGDKPRPLAVSQEQFRKVVFGGHGLLLITFRKRSQRSHKNKINTLKVLRDFRESLKKWKFAVSKGLCCLYLLFL